MDLVGSFTTSKQQQQPFRFLDLPPELRELVYEQAAMDASIIEIRKGRICGSPAHPLLMTSRVVFKEARTFVSDNPIVVLCGETDDELVFGKCLRRFDRRYPRQRHRLQFCVRPSWTIDQLFPDLFGGWKRLWRRWSREEDVKVSFQRRSGRCWFDCFLVADRVMHRIGEVMFDLNDAGVWRIAFHVHRHQRELAGPDRDIAWRRE